MHSEQATHLKPLFAAAIQHHRAGRLDMAARLYQTILEQVPGHADALHLLGVVSLQRGLHAQAIELMGQAIQENGTVAAFHNNLGNARRASGQLSGAMLAFARAVELDEGAVDARYNLAVVLQELGRPDAAALEYRRVLAAKPDHVAAHCNLGNLLAAQGRPTEALAAYDAALAGQADFLPALINRGNALRALGRGEDALQCYRRALEQDPRCAEAHNNLGLALLEAGQPEQAVSACRHALSVRPGYAEAHRILGNALRELGRTDEASAAYRQALQFDAADAEARLALCMLAIPVFADTVEQSAAAAAAFAQAVDELAAWNAEHPGRLGRAVGSAQPFYLAYRPVPLAHALSRYGDLVCPPAAACWLPEPALRVSIEPARRRRRVVIVCGHVHDRHPVWEVLLRGALEHLPRDRLELIVYHTGGTVDDQTAWAQARVDRFVQGPLSTAAWLEHARGDRPDVVLYPEIGMDPATCALAALRLAPLQVAWWGHPATTGLPSIDVYVSGDLLEPPDAAAHYRERLLCLPGTGACTRAPAAAARLWDRPRSRHDVVRFALPHQPIKFDPADDALLTDIARAVGPCEFWFASPAKLGWATGRLGTRLAAGFRQAGLDPQQHLRVTPWLPPAQFAGFLDAADVYLDCPAFSGYTTAWHAVHRGLPVVTLEGRFMRQRLAAGLLRQIDMPDGIAASRDGYIATAVRFAQRSRDAESRASQRQAIRQAAPRADQNLPAIAALAQLLCETTLPPRAGEVVCTGPA